MLRSIAFVVRLLIGWGLVLALLAAFWSALPLIGNFMLPISLLTVALPFVVIGSAVSHLERVRMMAGSDDRDALRNRQRRQIEIPFQAGDAFAMLDASVRELPGTSGVMAAADSLQIRARVSRTTAQGGVSRWRWNPVYAFGRTDDRILVTVTPNGDTSRVTVICEPELPAWTDLILLDEGSNYENAEAVSRAISRRVAERRAGERTAALQSDAERTAAVAKLSLLNAQVEPHFLYNTLANAQVLTRVDPARAEVMLGHLVHYLRHSLAGASTAPSTLGVELERAIAYLEILKIRMGSRLDYQVAVPEPLRALPMPPMMLQTLVENAIKHGLEPKASGGTVWIHARETGGRLTVTVADDGAGLGSATSGTGIGLANTRERLKLLYGERAALSLEPNFPAGVAATLALPAAAPAWPPLEASVEPGAAHG
jgi:signal transduction histidine kinase